MSTLICQNDQRRERVRAKARLNGLDYLEVSADQQTLTVYFLGKAPQPLTVANFKIEGGRRIPDIRVTAVRIESNPDPELDDVVTLTLNHYGDFSTYTLRLVGVQERIDPHYDHLDFSFKIDCPSDLDCQTVTACPPAPHVEPEISYLAKDYTSFRQLLLDRLALTMPTWQERHVPDLGIALVELLAYAGDYLSYYQDAVATEAYLDTARQRISVCRHARLVDYRMHEGCNSRTWVCGQVAETVEKITIKPSDVWLVTNLSEVLPGAQPVLALDELRNIPANRYQVFEPLVADPEKPLAWWSAHNTIHFYTWGERECCLPKGATGATLLDGPTPPQPPTDTSDSASTPSTDYRRLALQPGDVLVFEEVAGPRTGDSADADPAHRHAVRLTRVAATTDPLDGTPIVEVEWSAADALPFPLCLSAISDAEHGCVYHENLSIAHGNVVLVDHGRRLDEPENLGTVPTEYTLAGCDCAGHPSEVTPLAGPFRPQLANAPLTFSQPVDFAGAATQARHQDPRAAGPQITLYSLPGNDRWTPHFDLLGSGSDDRHFVVETDNDGHAHLRFGDGECGCAPAAGRQFTAEYRQGNGTTGNVGAEAIHHLVYRLQKPDGIDGVRNPLPADGGTDPEPINEVKLFAPSAFRQQQQRAITPDDYARLAERNPKIQRAAARLCWTGSGYEMQVAIDPVGNAALNDELRLEIERELYRFRRIGHELRIVAPHYIPLDIALEVGVKPDYLRGPVKAALLAVFSNRLLADGRHGFFHPDRLTFGDGIYLSQLVAAAQAVTGVDSVRVTRLQRQFELPNHELENGVLPLGPLMVARCDNDPDFPEQGRFELTVLGGR